MSLLQKFRTLPQKSRIAIGVGFLAWGTIGLYVSDSAEKKLGFEAKEEDRERLGKIMPRLEVVDREKS